MMPKDSQRISQGFQAEGYTAIQMTNTPYAGTITGADTKDFGLNSPMMAPPPTAVPIQMPMQMPMQMPTQMPSASGFNLSMQTTPAASAYAMGGSGPFPSQILPSLPTKAQTVKGADGPGLCLVNKGDKHQLRFKYASEMRGGHVVPALFGGVHEGMGLGRQYEEERIFGEWRYTESSLGDGLAISLQLERGEFLKVTDSDLVLDVAFWKMDVGTAVNFVGGAGERTYLKDGANGRSWVINNDGTISPKNYSSLVLGAGMPISATDLKGCWSCCCFPCGSAVMSISPENEDTYTECGVFFLFFYIPIPYGKKRRRSGRNEFVNVQDGNDKSAFVNKDKFYFPPGMLGCGGKC